MGKEFCFYHWFRTNFSGHNKLGGTAPEFPLHRSYGPDLTIPALRAQEARNLRKKVDCRVFLQDNQHADAKNTTKHCASKCVVNVYQNVLASHKKLTRKFPQQYLLCTQQTFPYSVKLVSYRQHDNDLNEAVECNQP